VHRAGRHQDDRRRITSGTAAPVGVRGRYTIRGISVPVVHRRPFDRGQTPIRFRASGRASGRASDPGLDPGSDLASVWAPALALVSPAAWRAGRGSCPARSWASASNEATPPRWVAPGRFRRCSVRDVLHPRSSRHRVRRRRRHGRRWRMDRPIRRANRSPNDPRSRASPWPWRWDRGWPSRTRQRPGRT
jgi:hypothetical protein